LGIIAAFFVGQQKEHDGICGGISQSLNLYKLYFMGATGGNLIDAVSTKKYHNLLI